MWEVVEAHLHVERCLANPRPHAEPGLLLLLLHPMLHPMLLLLLHMALLVLLLVFLPRVSRRRLDPSLARGTPPPLCSCSAPAAPPASQARGAAQGSAALMHHVGWGASTQGSLPPLPPACCRPVCSNSCGALLPRINPLWGRCGRRSVGSAVHGGCHCGVWYQAREQARAVALGPQVHKPPCL